MSRNKKQAGKTVKSTSGGTIVRRASAGAFIRWKEVTMHGVRVKVAENFPDAGTRWKRDTEWKKKMAS